MSAQVLKSDRWTGNISHDEEKRWPEAEDIDKTIRRLDGRIFTSVSITYDDENEMIVSGGNDERYVVNIMVDIDREFYNLTNGLAPSDEELPVASGGQMGSWLKHYIVDLETALEAALYFTKTGKPNDRLSWEHV